MSTTCNEKFNGETLKHFRTLANVSQEELGKRLGGIKKNNISMWERGIKAIPPKYILQLLSIFNLSVQEYYPQPAGNVSVDVSSGLTCNAIVANTSSLREVIKDAMMQKNICSALALNKAIGYGNVETLERLLAGKLVGWFPEVLGAIIDALDLPVEDLPISGYEKLLLPPKGIFKEGAKLTRPVPVFSMADAADGFGYHGEDGNQLFDNWNPETTETIPAPIENRQLVGFKISGNSMSPTIKDGDTVLCDRNGIASNGKVVVVKFADQTKYAECVVCKRYHKVGKTILLTSDNRGDGLDYNVQIQDLEWILPCYMLVSYNL
ncbi:MAG: LexA family transcriptional regulator [Lentisphaerae bacterium]|nr:LexA family transcriptional regulator [Lentisphaerota bacterium]